MELDPDGPVPLYRQLADLLRAEIACGTYPKGRAIPSVARLMQEYGLARGTVLHAVQILVEEELVIPVSGKGTFVR